MQMTVLIVFAVVLSFGAPGGPRLALMGWPALLAGVATYLFGAIALTWGLTRSGLRRLMKSGAPFAATVRGQHRRMLFVQLWLVFAMAALILGGASDRLRDLAVVGALPLGEEIVLLGVFFLATVLYWRITFRFEQEVRWQVEQDLMMAGLPVRAGWTARQHLGFNIRHNFLFVAVPVGLIMLTHDLVDRLAPRLGEAGGALMLAGAAKVLAVAVVFLFSPALLVKIWRTRPMPDGELRRRLERLCERIGLRYRQIRIWDTGGVVANAGVMGLHRSLRYILISDALLEQMPDREIVAVFGHEAGHVKGHHMGYFLLFMLGVMLGAMTLVSAGGLVAERLSVAPGTVAIGEQVAMAMLVFAAVALGFGWLSRRFERQADVYGAWCAGVDAKLNGSAGRAESDLAVGGAAFISALEGIARLNGLPRDGRNWRHGSIRTRVMFLLDWIGRGLSRRDFDRQVSVVKVWAWLLLTAAAIGAVLTRHRWL